MIYFQGDNENKNDFSWKAASLISAIASAMCWWTVTSPHFTMSETEDNDIDIACFPRKRIFKD